MGTTLYQGFKKHIEVVADITGLVNRNTGGSLWRRFGQVVI
jgi:hypothetical protein